jgi:putative transposase
MAQSLSNVLVHIVVSTKGHQPLITEHIGGELYAYVMSIFSSHNCPVVRIGGHNDHIHILCNLARTISISELMEQFKSSSSKWIKTKKPEIESFYWQNGYGVFSVSQSNAKTVAAYIERQADHHRKLSFKDEFRMFLKKHNVSFDERYVWD